MSALLTVGFALLAQSALLLLLGLSAAWLVRRRGPALRAFVLQMTLAGAVLGAVLSVCVSGRVQPVWSVRLPVVSAPVAPLAGVRTEEPSSGASPSPSSKRRGLGKMAQPALRHVFIPSPPPLMAHSSTGELARVRERISWLDIALGSLWVGGTGLLWIWLIACQRHLTCLRNKSTLIPEGRAAETLARLAAARGLKPPLLLTSPAVRSPFLAGVWRPAIFLPASWEADYDTTVLHVILAHELAHHARRDCVWTLLLRLITALLWPQPLLWLLGRQLEQATEEACDLWALTPDCPPHRYADCLLTLAEHAFPARAERALGAGVTPVRSALGRRIQAVLERRNTMMKPLSPRLQAAVACGMVLIALLGSHLVSAAQPPAAQPSTSQSLVQAKAYQQVSLSNLKQIGLAMLEYSADHNQRFPDAQRWMDEIIPYLIPRQITGAKRQQEIASLFHDPAAPAGQTWSYAYNRALSGLSFAKVNNPTLTVAVFESTRGVWNASDMGQSIPAPGWHGGGSDYLFTDGHAKWFGAQVRSLPFSPSTSATSPGVPVRGIPVSGYLYDRRTHKPLAGVTVDFSNQPPTNAVRFMSTTGPTGQFHSVLYPGRNALIVDDAKQGDIKERLISYGHAGVARGITSIMTISASGKRIGPLPPTSYQPVMRAPDGYTLQMTEGKACFVVIPVSQFEAKQ